MGYTAFLLLLCSLGSAITVQAQDCPYPVGGEHMELSDKDINSKTFPDGSQVTFVCKVGYKSEAFKGSEQIVCSAGSWSLVQMKCKRKFCDTVKGGVSDGNVNYPSGTSFGDQAVITCNPGFRLVGRKTLTCRDQGWSGRLPLCEIVTCDEPPTVANAEYSPSDKEVFEYGEGVSYSCTGDLLLNGTSSLVCGEDGTFKPNPPVCVSVGCEEPRVDFAEWDGGSRFPYKYTESVTLKCLSGYVMTGLSTISCGINSKWIPKLPSCAPKLPSSTPKLPSCAPKLPSSTPKPSSYARNGGNLPVVLGAVFGGNAFLLFQYNWM